MPRSVLHVTGSCLFSADAWRLCPQLGRSWMRASLPCSLDKLSLFRHQGISFSLLVDFICSISAQMCDLHLVSQHRYAELSLPVTSESSWSQESCAGNGTSLQKWLRAPVSHTQGTACWSMGCSAPSHLGMIMSANKQV